MCGHPVSAKLWIVLRRALARSSLMLDSSCSLEFSKAIKWWKSSWAFQMRNTFSVTVCNFYMHCVKVSLNSIMFVPNVSLLCLVSATFVSQDGSITCLLCRRNSGRLRRCKSMQDAWIWQWRNQLVWCGSGVVSLAMASAREPLFYVYLYEEKTAPNPTRLNWTMIPSKSPSTFFPMPTLCWD